MTCVPLNTATEEGTVAATLNRAIVEGLNGESRGVRCVPTDFLLGGGSVTCVCNLYRFASDQSYSGID